MKVEVNGKYYVNFTDYAMNQDLDSVASVFSFACLYNPDDQTKNDLFTPLSYPEVKIFDDDDKLILTGYITNHIYGSSDMPGLALLSGYSKGGILEDCTISPSNYPLESIGRNLIEICDKILKPFNLSYIIDSSIKNEARFKYKKSVADPTESIKSYLSKITSQRNILLSHNEKGDLIFYRFDKDGRPKKTYTKQNTKTMTLDVNGQEMHSELSILRQAGKNSSKNIAYKTQKNSMVKLYRPSVQILTSGTENDTEPAVHNYIAAELKSGLKVTMSFGNKEDINVGDIVLIQNEEIFIKKETKFIVQSKSISSDSEKDEVSVNCVSLQSFTGGEVINIFE